MNIDLQVIKELAAAKGERRQSVPPGAVLVTGAGALGETHGVKKVFHVASVQPNQVGDGWRAVDRVERCVALCLRKADSMAEADHRDDLESIRCSTLVVVGDEDTVTGPAKAAELADGIPGASLVTIEAAGHLANQERPAAFNDAVAEFLAEVDVAG